MLKRPDTEKEKAIDTVIELMGKYKITSREVVDRVLMKVADRRRKEDAEKK